MGLGVMIVRHFGTAQVKNMKNKNYNKSSIHKTIEKKLKIMDDFQREFPNIYRLQIPIYYEGNCAYVLGSDVRKGLDKKQRKQYSKFLGINTGILTKEGKFGIYPHDSELALKQLFQGYKPSIEEWD